MSAPRGDHFENLQAHDNARMHNGHNYNTYNYNYSGSVATDQELKKQKDESKQYHLNVELVKAARTGQVIRVDHLLRSGADANFEYVGSPEYSTPLHDAVTSGHKGTVQAIIDAGADVCKIPKSRKSTPLLEASIRGYDKIISLLLKSSSSSANIFCVANISGRLYGRLPVGIYGMNPRKKVNVLARLLQATDLRNIRNIRCGNPEDISDDFDSIAIWADCIADIWANLITKLTWSGCSPWPPPLDPWTELIETKNEVLQQLESLEGKDRFAVHGAIRKIKAAPKVR